jgi:flagellar transcriptional activator FlhD
MLTALTQAPKNSTVAPTHAAIIMAGLPAAQFA